MDEAPNPTLIEEELCKRLFGWNPALEHFRDFHCTPFTSISDAMRVVSKMVTNGFKFTLYMDPDHVFARFERADQIAQAYGISPSTAISYAAYKVIDNRFLKKEL